MRRKIASLLVLFFLLCTLPVKVYPAEKKDFSGDVTLMKQENNQYVMQVTVANQGKDFTGYVRVIFDTKTSDTCAYDTKIVLPAQGQKQFSLCIPEGSVDPIRGKCELSFVTDKGEKLQSITCKNPFGNTSPGIPVGVLSDHFDALSYLDMDGMTMYLKTSDYPVSLIECTPEDIADKLELCTFLVIDTFDMHSLEEEAVKKIEEWVEQGGCLILGTGAHAQEIISGFSDDFLGAAVTGISEEGEPNIASRYAAQYDYYYYMFKENQVDFSAMAIAEFSFDGSNFSENSDFPGYIASVGSGAVELLSFSLTDPEMSKLSGTSAILMLYEGCYYNSASSSESSDSNGLGYQGRDAFGQIDGANTSVDFGFMKLLIGIYVVLVGPILYLILKKCKKSEWYWVGAPALGIVFIGLVFFFGQGARVRDTRVYSVTSQSLGGNKADTYMMAYRPGLKEWRLQLKDHYDVASAGTTDVYYSGMPSDYHYIVRRDENGLSCGIKPLENFESAFFYASGQGKEEGSVLGENLLINEFEEISGTVTNDTDRDFSYLAVMTKNKIVVIADVAAHETISLEKAEKEGRVVYKEMAVSLYDDIYYGMVSSNYYNRQNTYYREDALGAFFIGLMSAYRGLPDVPQNAVLAGLVENYDPVVADDCVETSYSCLYSFANVQVMEAITDYEYETKYDK